MKPPVFAYHRAAHLDDALSVLAEHGDEAKVLAGGQSLVPMLNLRLARPGVLVDVNRIGLNELTAQNGTLRLGALVRHRTLEEHPQVLRDAPLLAAAAPLIGHPPIRARGTLGGSLAHADPAAELPTAALALGAAIQLASSAGRRTVAAHDFFLGPFMTVMRDDEMVVAVEVPRHGEAGCAYEQVAIRAGDFAVVGVAAMVELGADGCVTSARIAIAGAAGAPVRADQSELAVAGRRLDASTLRDAGEAAAAAVEPSGDLHGSSAYRSHLTDVLTRRALTNAAGRAANR
jgi:carbon-monoxide dehydrogenase medium subunit